MADAQPPDPIPIAVSAEPETSVHPTVAATDAVGSKRQRRPSVRLGDIGGEYDAHSKRGASSSNTHKALKQNSNFNNHNQFGVDTKKDGYGLSNKGSSKTRVLTNLPTGGGDFNETLDSEKEGNLDGVAIGSWKVRDSKKRGVTGYATKRIRSKYAYSKIDEEGVEFETENCDDDSPVNSIENLGDGNERKEREDGYYNRRRIKGKDLANHRGGDGIELSCPSDNEANNDRFGGEDGVRIWLNSIGLGRYAPVFEIHEVDDEVLPQLTLEDLKDMGITAVGSRRKMFSAIQKLSKGFS